MRRVLCLGCFVFLACCQAVTHAAPQWDNTSKLAPLVARVEVSLNAHRALIAKLQSDRQTLAELVGATGDLEPIYVTVVNDYRSSIESAVAVSSAVAALNQVAIALFEEWRSEIGYLTDDRIKTSNEAQFAAQWQRYEGLIRVLQQSEAMIDPVLAELKGNVVYFKQALDEASVAARKTELVAADSDIEALIGALTNAVTRSDGFLKEMQ